MWRAPEGLVGLAAVLGGGGGTWPGFETTRPDTHSDTATPVWRAPEGLVGLAAVLAGGPPPAGTTSSPAPQSTSGAQNTGPGQSAFTLRRRRVPGVPCS